MGSIWQHLADTVQPKITTIQHDTHEH